MRSVSLYCLAFGELLGFRYRLGRLEPPQLVGLGDHYDQLDQVDRVSGVSSMIRDGNERCRSYGTCLLP